LKRRPTAVDGGQIEIAARARRRVTIATQTASARREAGCEKVCHYASERIGLGYDHKNIIDLMRYPLPWPATQRWRRRMIKLGCYAIPPKITRAASATWTFRRTSWW
jgi:hypothetical protein